MPRVPGKIPGIFARRLVTAGRPLGVSDLPHGGFMPARFCPGPKISSPKLRGPGRFYRLGLPT